MKTLEEIIFEIRNWNEISRNPNNFEFISYYLASKTHVKIKTPHQSGDYTPQIHYHIYIGANTTNIEHPSFRLNTYIIADVNDTEAYIENYQNEINQFVFESSFETDDAYKIGNMEEANCEYDGSEIQINYAEALNRNSLWEHGIIYDYLNVMECVFDRIIVPKEDISYDKTNNLIFGFREIDNTTLMDGIFIQSDEGPTYSLYDLMRLIPPYPKETYTNHNFGLMDIAIDK